jgi:hypothetical protein
MSTNLDYKDLFAPFVPSYHTIFKKLCHNPGFHKDLCTEAAFAVSFAHSSGPFFALVFAFGVFSGESFAAVSFTRASSFELFS